MKSRRRRIERELKSWPQRLARKPRKPFYSAKVGQASGTFTTKWFDREPKEPYEEGTAELNLMIDGKPVKFTRLGVHAILGRDRGMDGRRPPTIVFTGKRESNKIRVTFVVGTEQSAFEEPNGEATVAVGMMMQGFRFDLWRMLGGTIVLDEAGMEAGDIVRGTLKVDVVQMKGEMR